MTRKQLFKAINELCNELDIRYDINSGGCCFVAAVIAEQLEKYNIPYSAYECLHPVHYVIRVSDRFLNRGDYNISTRFELYEWNSSNLFNYYYSKNWNERYSRRWNLIVKTRINSLFRKYGNSI